tara:strand:+ start:5297 stop:5494 length:198 start_codon:yes stop_codon:yes gene_type:complete
MIMKILILLLCLLLIGCAKETEVTSISFNGTEPLEIKDNFSIPEPELYREQVYEEATEIVTMVKK